MAWLVAGLALLGFGNTLVLPLLIGATLGEVRPAQAGVASGTLNTAQQFAGTAGLAVIGTVFFSALGPHPGRAGFASAAETVVWINLALIAVMAGLTAVLTRPVAETAAAAADDPAAVAAV